MALTKFTEKLISDSFKTTISGSDTAESSSFASRVTLVEAGSTSKTLVSSSVLSSPSQGTIRLATNGVNTDVDSGLQSGDSPTFAGGTITGDFAVGGTLTAQEVHTEFESASILFTSGSTQFGNSSDDVHDFKGNTISGSSTSTGSFGSAHFRGVGGVGIGTNNPSNVLHLEFNDDSDVFTAARITDNSVSGILINNLDTGNGHGGMLKFANKGGDNHTAIAHSQDGNTDASLLFYSMDGGSLAEVMRVDHTHRLGIGNGSPSYKLDVTENAETNVVRFFNDGGDSNRDVMILQGGADDGPRNTRFITFKDGNGDDFGCIQGPDSSATAGISFNTTADTALLTLSGSRVGIGTINPTSTSQLHVEAAKAEIRIKGTNDSASDEIAHLILEASTDRRAGITIEGDSNDIQAFMGRPYDTANTLVFETDATERMRINSSGNVGIATASPLATLHVEHTTDDTDENGNIALTVGGGASGDVRHYWGVNNSSNYAYYGAVEHGTQYVPLILQPNGSNVGIGTTAPSIKFEVDAGSSSDIARFHNDSSTSGLVIGYTTNLCGFDLAASQALRIRQGSSVPFLLNTNGVMDGDFNDTSDIALKKDIEDLTDTIDGVKALKPSTFKWIDELRGDKTKIGFIAQDVEEQFPELIDGDDGRKSINTIGLVSVLTKTIQGLIKRIEALESN